MPDTASRLLASRAQTVRNAAVPAFGLTVSGLFLVWAVHDGGYDADTWYWGALLMLALLGVAVIGFGRTVRISRPAVVAISALAGYVAWSYISLAWAEAPGTALEGSNRALLYLLVFAVMVVIPWQPRTATLTLVAFAIGLGVVAIVLLVRLASSDNIGALVIDRRLAAPTGYFNATAALFTIEALLATVLSVRRELPAVLRALLITFACAGLQLALIVQSRGWLFTLPVVLAVAIAVAGDRLRVAAAAVIPVAAVLAPLGPLLRVYRSGSGPALEHAAGTAGRTSLLLCGAMFVAGWLVASGERLYGPRGLSEGRRRRLGIVVAVGAVAGGFAGGVVATHGHPFRFISRQWRGFSHIQPARSGSTSHFGDVGSGRYDFWRVSLDAFVAHPIGGLGQDNFDDYYVRRRHTGEEPAWTHSLEMRLLAHTGAIGVVLFGAFLAAALMAVARVRGRGGGDRAEVAGAAVLPLVVWLIHGSVDWFWEIPALAGPALGFLGMAVALLRAPPQDGVQDEKGPRATSAVPFAWRRVPGPVAVAAGTVAFLAAALVLAFPYLSVREVSLASDLRTKNPAAALRDLKVAAELNPLSPEPGLMGGTIALQISDFRQARERFQQAIGREPGGWFGWFGAGLADSGLGRRRTAHYDLSLAKSINSRQPVIGEALGRVYSAHPLPATEALGRIELAG